MATDVPLRCSCGSVRGSARVDGGLRLVCMCADCQAFAHYLERADDILDEHGGTDIYQLAPAQVAFSEGIDQLRCMRLSPKGTLRWFTGCCRTPVANTVSAAVPFMGMPHLLMDHAADGRSRDAALGPVTARCYGSHAVGGRPPGSQAKVSAPTLVRSLGRLAGHRLRGRHRPFVLFDADTGRPISEPTVLSLEQRRRVTPAVDRWMGR